MEQFLLVQINIGLALAHTAACFEEGSRDREMKRIAARFRYERVLWFLSRLELSPSSTNALLDSLDHLKMSIAVCGGGPPTERR